MSTYDDPNPNTRNTRAKPVKVTADPTQVAALTAQLARLARWEVTNPTYREMCALATARKMGTA